jgi:hypothetical protein
MSTCNKIEKPGKMEYMDRRKVNETETVLAAQRVEVESKTIKNIPIGINCSCCRYASLGTTKKKFFLMGRISGVTSNCHVTSMPIETGKGSSWVVMFNKCHDNSLHQPNPLKSIGPVGLAHTLRDPNHSDGKESLHG